MIRSSLLARARRVAAPVALSLAVATASAPALAASQRTFVSTSGVDNPACSIAAPCRSFTAAIAATNAGGEVIVQDSGGYGPVTIAKSVSILAPAGVYAGISVFSGDGVTVATPSPSDKVVLQGLVINSQGSNGNGIHFTGAGTLEVARTRISGFEAGSGVRLRTPPPGEGAGSLHAVDLAVSSDNAVVVRRDRCPPTPRRPCSNGSMRAGIHVGIHVGELRQCRGRRFPDHAEFRWCLHRRPAPPRVILLTARSVRRVAQRTGFAVGIDNSGSTYATITGSTLAQNRGRPCRSGSNSTARLAGTTIAQNVDRHSALAGGVVESQGNNFIWGNTNNGPAPTVVGSK